MVYRSNTRTAFFVVAPVCSDPMPELSGKEKAEVRRDAKEKLKAHYYRYQTRFQFPLDGSQERKDKKRAEATSYAQKIEQETGIEMNVRECMSL